MRPAAAAAAAADAGETPAGAGAANLAAWHAAIIIPLDRHRSPQTRDDRYAGKPQATAEEFAGELFWPSKIDGCV